MGVKKPGYQTRQPTWQVYPSNEQESPNFNEPSSFNRYVHGTMFVIIIQVLLRK